MKRKKYYTKKKKRSGKPVVIVIALVLVLVLIALGLLLLCRKRAEKDAGAIPPGAEVGDVIRMGAYEQDGLDNGTEPIEWRILDIRDGKALILSCPAIDCMAFGESGARVSWADSSLRRWLNADFYEASFSDAEKSTIALTDVLNPGTFAGYDASGCWLVSNSPEKLETVLARTDGQENTRDRVFLLSIDEVAQYFPSGSDAKAFLSDYGTGVFIQCGLEQAKQSIAADEAAILANYEIAAEKYGRGFCHWWLRSPGIMPGGAAAVDYDGSAGDSMTVTEKDGGVRPAMWIMIP